MASLTLKEVEALISGTSYVFKEIKLVGDSLSAITNGITPANQLATNFPNTTIVNYGIGGDNSTQIATRVGAIPVYVTVTGNQIPASGGVAVSPQYPEPIQDGNTVTGNLYGVRGTFTRSGTTYTFTRLTSGTAVSIPTPQRYSMFIGDNLLRNSLCIVEVGQNDARDVKRTFVAGKPTGNPVVLENLKAIRKAAGPLGKCLFVQVNGYNSGTYSDGTGDFGFDSIRYAPPAHVNPLSLDWLMLSEFKDDYIPMVNMMLLAGNGTANDNTDISNGRIPYSLRYGAFVDNDVHLNATGAAYKANVYTGVILSKGLLTSYPSNTVVDPLQNAGTLLRFNFKNSTSLPVSSGATISGLGTSSSASVANNSGTLAFNNTEHAYLISSDGDFLDFGAKTLNNFIACFRIKTTVQNQQFKQAFGDHEGSGQVRIDIADDGALRGFIYTSAGNNQGQGPVLTANTWCHVGFERYSGGFKFYLDGVLANTYSTSGTNLTTTNALRLGRDTRAYYQSLYLEDTGLSGNNAASQILAHYNESIS